MPRVVVPGLPHHVTQRGNRRQATFFCATDFELYKQLLGTWCRRLEVEIWAYCLMPNHVHLIVKPSTETALARAVGEAHRRYSATVNRRGGWTGYLWQGRFASCPMDGTHLLRAVRYVLLNPMAAGLVSRVEDWPHSSAGALLNGWRDPLVAATRLAGRVPDWRRFLAHGFADAAADAEEIERHQRTGRPFGSSEFVAALEQTVGRSLRPGKRGPRGGAVAPGSALAAR